MNLKSDHPNKILVIQLARLGDFLQTTPLLASIKTAFPKARLTVMVSHGQKNVASDNPDVDQVIPIDLSALESLANNPNPTLGQKLELMHQGLGGLREQTYDLIINVNMSPLAALLAELPQARLREGPGLAWDRVHLQPAPWNIFIMNLMSRRRLIRFNLVDLLLNYSVGEKPLARGLRFKVPAKSLEAGSRLLHEKSGPGFMVGFQLGSRHQARQWPPEYFARLTQLLVDRHQARIAFLGTEQEREISQAVLGILSREASHLKNNIIDLMGRTTVSELAGVLSQLDALVTTDTGTMHLAAAVGTPILGLFIGPAYCHETGPYGAGHLIMQVDLECSPCLENKPTCRDCHCRRLITLDQAWAGIQWLVSRQASQAPEAGPGVQVMVSGFDQFGLTFKPLTPRPLTADDVWALAYREAGRGFMRPGYSLSTEKLLADLSEFKPPFEELPADLNLDLDRPDTAPLARIYQQLRQHGLVPQAERLVADAARVVELASRAKRWRPVDPSAAVANVSSDLDQPDRAEEVTSLGGPPALNGNLLI